MKFSLIIIQLLTLQMSTSRGSSSDFNDYIKFSFSKYDQPVCQKSVELVSPRYLLYDVNPGEGFNLRRDVYLRVASLVHILNNHGPWILVLPPWGYLYHWRMDRNSYHLWKDFFDLTSMNKYVNVIELPEFMKDSGNYANFVMVLQHYAEGWGEKFEEKYESRPCLERNNFWQKSHTHWEFNKWGRQFKADNFSCLSFQGRASAIVPLLTEELRHRRSILIDRAETLLHDDFGGANYWAARRSMRFASHLIEEAGKFRKRYLMSEDISDKTVIPDDWRDFKSFHGDALGGPYLAAHLRRRDFLYARSKEVPTIEHTADQLRTLLLKLQLNILFVATDAPDEELEELHSHLSEFKVHNYVPSSSYFEKVGDGGVAIVEQIICSHARCQ